MSSEEEKISQTKRECLEDSERCTKMSSEEEKTSQKKTECVEDCERFKRKMWKRPRRRNDYDCRRQEVQRNGMHTPLESPEMTPLSKSKLPLIQLCFFSSET